MEREKPVAPTLFGLPHTDWRPHQYETVRWALDLEGVGVLEAPTGSGKSAVARAVASRKTTVVLTRTKQLQQQYATLYGARVVYGRANYPCAAYPDLTADDCPYHSQPQECPYRHQCPYLVACRAARESAFVVLNYAYALASRWLASDQRQAVVLDEAHNLSDVALEWAGCTIRERDRVEFGLPDFPTITHRAANVLLRLPDPVDMATSFLEQCRSILRRCDPAKASTPAEREHLRRGMRLARKVESTLAAMRQCKDAWFIRSGVDPETGITRFVARPLTARFHFPSLFQHAGTTLAMSATIGDPQAFAEELGIVGYDFLSVPSRFSPDQRRVWALDTPGMGRSASPQDFEHQADAIASALKHFPRWSGLVLVTRKSEAIALAKRLGVRGLADRVWVTPGADGQYAPTDEQVKAWEQHRRRVPSAVCITWAFWEGYDGRDERICIVAKVPFPYLGDAYERERMEYSRRFFLQRTAWMLEQGLGRTRRGRDEDYGDENGFVAIADGDWRRVQKQLSQALRDALVVS